MSMLPLPESHGPEGIESSLQDRKIDLRTIVQTGCYFSSCRFLNMQRFLDFSVFEDQKVQNSNASIRQAIEGLVTEASWNARSHSQIQYLKHLVKSDLDLISVSVRDLADKKLSFYLDVKEHIESIAKDATKIIQARVKSYKEPSLFFVDRFPEPFSDRPHFAINLDEGDYINYGLEPGIYFLNSRLKPVYSAYLYLHELGHTIMGQRSPTDSAFGIEEGLCELLGSFYLSFRLLPKKTVRNLFRLNRHFGSHDVHWEYYRHNTRMMLPLLVKYGWEAMFFLLSKGRSYLKNVENSMYHATWNLPISIKNSDDDHIGEVITSVLSDNDTYVLSPRACYISQFMHAGLSVREVSFLASVSLEETREAAEELSNKFSAATLRPDSSVVSFSDCPRMLMNPGAFRYDI